ncbi:1-acyl-sn-glycerol-3-phosphate acyltransferase [Chlamydiales bacterium]|nr:1-acyl-sn-glycerol-3-phosphate acyltransferase [Chlamydiales bacterium]
MDPIAKRFKELNIAENQIRFFTDFIEGFRIEAPKSGAPKTLIDEIIDQFATLVIKEWKEKTPFNPYNPRKTSPVNYTEFAKNLIGSTIDIRSSKIFHKENLAEIQEALERGENVILFANHQIEPDPQVLQILLENEELPFANDVIFVAGDRVINDPMSIPLSLGCNLLCIYSRKYMDDSPEDKEMKLLHNRKTMREMGSILDEGGHIIYVAPSGGRDRKNPDGTITPALFDPNSIEMFHLMSRQAKKITNFYPLALSTYDLLPPPQESHKELGEVRIPAFSPAYLSFGNKISFDPYPHLSKKEARVKRAESIYADVLNLYKNLP